MTTNEVGKVHMDEVAPNVRRGGDLRVLLSPRSVGATSGFMGVGTLAPGDRIADHYHPHSEEFLYCVRGALELTLDGGAQVLDLGVGEAVMIPRGLRHRLRNTGVEPAFVVFHNSPLATSPELGHVDVEPVRGDLPDHVVGGRP